MEEGGGREGVAAADGVHPDPVHGGEQVPLRCASGGLSQPVGAILRAQQHHTQLETPVSAIYYHMN